MTLHRQPIKGSSFSLIHYDELSPHIVPAKVEKEKGCKYVGEFTLRASTGGWINASFQLYYQDEVYKDDNGEHSNYFALYYSYNNELMITDGITAVLTDDHKPLVYSAVLDEDSKDALYSAYRHDYQTHSVGENKLIIDGGRDYVKSSMHPMINFTIENGTVTYKKPVLKE